MKTGLGMTSKRPERLTLSTAVDGNARLHAELVLWVVCATRVLPRDKYGLVVYLIDYEDAMLEQWLLDRGVDVRHRSAPVAGVPHCNRLAAFMDHHDSDYVLATDSDLFFVRDPAELFTNAELLRAAPNNACNPPPSIFKRLLMETGLGKPYRPTFTLMPGATGKQETHINNISAGIVALPTDMAQRFAHSWGKWATWLGRRTALLDQWSGHVDQIAFALACEEASEDVVFLPPQVNLVLHLLEKVDTVYAFHLSSAHVPEFSDRFRFDKTLVANGLSADVVVAIEVLNACIVDACRQIERLPAMRESLHAFLNPKWVRS